MELIKRRDEHVFSSKHTTHKNASGFTLIELLIVLAIIGIIAAVAIPQDNQYKVRAYDAHSKQAIRDIGLICNAYWNETDFSGKCSIPVVLDSAYGYKQNSEVEVRLDPAPFDTFCASAKHNSSPNTYSIDSASVISEGGDCGGAVHQYKPY